MFGAQLQHFPVALFSMTLGLGGFTLATQRLEQIFSLPAYASMAFLCLSILIYLGLMALFVGKFIRYPQTVKDNFNHPVKIHFFPTISIGLMLLSVAIAPQAARLAYVLAIVAVAVHFIFSLTIISMWMIKQHFVFKTMNPSWFIPAVGNIVAPIALMPHGLVELSWFFFALGFCFWVILLVIFFNRIIFHPPLPLRLLPTLFILIAPPSVGFVSYTLLGASFDAFSRILYYFAVFLVILLTIQLFVRPKIGFFLSWWAYSFPIAAFSIATFVMYEQTANAFFLNMALMAYVILSLLILRLLIETTIAIKAGKIFVPVPEMND